MCVILAIAPNVDIEEQKIISACEVNNDGYGMTIINDGKFETIRNITPNKPDDLMKRLEDARDHVRMVHLRFRTDGDISMENCHPFEVLNKNDHGIDIQFMHNGVIHDFSGGKEAASDTYRFNELVLKPLLKRSVLALEDPTTWHEDAFVRMVLSKYAGVSNVFAVFDPIGGHIITNKNRGASYEGWWASNEYSFNRYHREPQTTKGGYWEGSTFRPFHTSTGNGSTGVTTNGVTCSVPNKETKNVPFVPSTGENKKVLTLADHRNENLKKKGKMNASVGPATAIIKANEDVRQYLNVDIIAPDKRPTFCELMKIENLDKLAYLELQDIDDLVTEHPELTTILIMDLLYDRYMALDKSATNKAQGVG